MWTHFHLKLHSEHHKCHTLDFYLLFLKNNWWSKIFWTLITILLLHEHTQKTQAYSNVHILNKDELLVGGPCIILDFAAFRRLLNIWGTWTSSNFLLFVVKRDCFIVSNTSLVVPVKFQPHPTNLNQRLLNL